VFGFLASPRHGIVAALAALLLWSYAARLKGIAGVGHALVGATLASAVLYGALAVESRISAPVGAGALLAFVLVAAREVVKAIPDIEGDRAFGAATLPTVIGPRAAAGVTVAVIAAVTAGLPLLVTAGYQAMVLAYLLPMAGLLLAAAWALLATDALQRAGGGLRWGYCASRASGLMKLALGAGVAALALGR
jgi:geranylgeranylglycerol-phosphate geranylgeranyltransferase